MILALGFVGFVYMRPAPVNDVEVSNMDKKVVVEEPKETVVENVAPSVKEFAVDAFYDDKGVWFSLKEISVKKGDNVKIMVKNIKGVHDFSLDEYGIKKDLPLDEEVVIEFVADKSGEFVYYCSVPGHKEKGQWGTLKVSE